MIINKKSILVIAFVLLCIYASIFVVRAHNSNLDVEYDPCEVRWANSTQYIIEDGENELWYSIGENNRHNNHVEQNIKILRYCFVTNDPSVDALDIPTDTIDEIKNSFICSMKKWSNICYYTINELGDRVSESIISFEPGEIYNSHILIKLYSDLSFPARATMYSDFSNPDGEDNYHHHCNKWFIEIDVNDFYSHDGFYNFDNIFIAPITEEVVISYRERTGAHELGHILGLEDIDDFCETLNAAHHQESVMGDGDRASNYPTYKDIAGVAITRGLHTDDNHLWMVRFKSDGATDVICAICNGVMYDIDLDDNEYSGLIQYEDEDSSIIDLENSYVYKSCSHHPEDANSIERENEMMLMATDGIRNFYKCRYCRYIVETNIDTDITLEENIDDILSDTISAYDEKYYTLEIGDATTYKFQVNYVEGLEIDLFDSDLNNTDLITSDVFGTNGQNIALSSGTYYLKLKNPSSTSITANVSIYNHTHSFTTWTKHNSTHHIECCEYCGEKGTRMALHYVKQSEISLNIGFCAVCGAKVMLGDDIIQVGPLNTQKVTPNGSYLLPNGIPVLVDEDIEAYLNGTLVWYDKDNLPQTQ